jgi:hypothetical protein
MSSFGFPAVTYARQPKTEVLKLTFRAPLIRHGAFVPHFGQGTADAKPGASMQLSVRRLF